MSSIWDCCCSCCPCYTKTPMAPPPQGSPRFSVAMVRVQSQSRSGHDEGSGASRMDSPRPAAPITSSSSSQQYSAQMLASHDLSGSSALARSASVVDRALRPPTAPAHTSAGELGSASAHPSPKRTIQLPAITLVATGEMIKGIPVYVTKPA